MKAIKEFRGMRNGGLRVFIEFEDGAILPLIEPLHHSPDGFECGYEGSGPTDLAIAMCHVLCPAEKGERVHNLDGYHVGHRAWLAHGYVRSQIILQLPREGQWRVQASDVRDRISEALRKLEVMP